MRLQTFLIAAGTLLLSGCASHYQPPASGEIATVLFSSEGVGVQPMICVPGKGFRETRFAVAGNPLKSEAIAQLQKKMGKQATVETSIPAGESARLGFSYTENTQGGAGARDRCTVAVLFTPVGGATYDAVFSLSNNECAMSLTSNGEALPDAVLAPWQCP